MSDTAIATEQRRAAALVAAGYNPPPAVGQVWQDTTASYLPSRHRRLVRITSIGNTVSGWQCRVLAWVEDPEATTPPGRVAGVLHVATLLRDYRSVSCPVPSPDGVPCARIIPAGWAFEDGHPGGHVWMWPDTQELLERGHYDATAALAGEPFAAHLPENCRPGCPHRRPATATGQQPHPAEHPQHAPGALTAANERRRAAAAAVTGSAVRHALTTLGDRAPADLAAAGRLRLAHPDASLAALAALADPPATKDTVAGRLRRLIKAAGRM